MMGSCHGAYLSRTRPFGVLEGVLQKWTIDAGLCLPANKDGGKCVYVFPPRKHLLMVARDSFYFPKVNTIPIAASAIIAVAIQPSIFR